MSQVIVLGAGLSGLASAALLARAGHDVTVIERHSWLGGKSRRVEVAGQIMDTGPALVTFTGVWEKLLASYDKLGEKRRQLSSGRDLRGQCHAQPYTVPVIRER